MIGFSFSSFSLYYSLFFYFVGAAVVVVTGVVADVVFFFTYFCGWCYRFIRFYLSSSSERLNSTLM